MANNEWYTPKHIIGLTVKVMGVIDLDPASNEIANRVVNAGEIYTVNDNGLSLPWFGNVWVNPPYGRGDIDKFSKRQVANVKALNKLL